LKAPAGVRPALAYLLGTALALLAAFLVYRGALRSEVRPPRSPLLAFPGAPAGRIPPLLVHVTRHESYSRILEQLEDQGSIPLLWPLRVAARLRGWDRTVVPGWYRFRSGESALQLLARLGRGESEMVRLTLPEGWRLDRILSAVADSAWLPLDSLRAVAADTGWLRRQHVPGPGLEGYLFPDTYRLPRAERPRLILESLLRPGADYWRDSLAVPAAGAGVDRRTLWTLASVIESEAHAAPERSRISAVFWNRLRLGMRLESDPTVLYALGRPPGRLLYADLAVDSPYNTYRSAGLPPGPICSPGRASLRAALRPQANCSDLFFVARGDGTHVFSRSLEEHELARRRLRREEARGTATGSGRLRGT